MATTLQEAVTQLTEALDVPVGDASQLAPNATRRPLWGSPDAYVMVWPTDDGFDVQVVATIEEACVELAERAARAVGRKARAKALQVEDPRRAAWVITG